MSTDEPARKLPLDSWHRNLGGRMVPFAGYEMPVQYDRIMAEHLWTRESAGLFDVSHMGQLLISGDGVAEALEALLPADIAGLGEGRTRYSLLLGDNGGILDDLMVTRRADAVYVVVNGATKYDDIAHIHDRLPEAVTLNHMEDAALLALQGPRAVDVLARLIPGVERLTFMTADTFPIEGIDAWISRSGYTGEDGFEISIPGNAAGRIADLLIAQPEVKPIGLGARDSLRLEAGMPLYGHDLGPDITPVTADLSFALARRRRAEGGFPGAERILGELERGSVSMRVGLEVEGRQPVREGAAILNEEGSEVGRITSGGFSPTLQRPIAMGYVPLSLAAPGSAVTVAQRGKLFQAVTVTMPFVPHRYHRKGGSK